MSLEIVCRAYAAAVDLEERLQRQSPELAEEAGLLRSDLHALVMESLRQSNIPFADRAHAAQIAFEIVQRKRKTA